MESEPDRLDGYGAVEDGTVKETLAVLCFGILGWFCYLNGRTIREQAREIRELGAKIAIETKNGNLDLQKQCSEQALLTFRDLGWGKTKAAFFTDHYNAKMNKCFIRIENSDIKFGIPTVWKSLNDAYERTQYGEYLWMNTEGKKYWEVKPTTCSVTLPSGEKKDCLSDAEFDVLAKVYLE